MNKFPGILSLAFCIATIGCAASRSSDRHNGNSPFEYKEIYLPLHGSPEYAALGLNSLDNDWGIWGHNLDKVLPEKHSHSVYAKVNGETLDNQYCFSSDYLFRYIVDYIDDNYSPADSMRFAILPNDNNIVCLCETCVALGNKKNDASPAVTALIGKLAARFPSHSFFTSDYRTTRALPEEELPENAGVFISAIDFPPAAVNTLDEEQFTSLLNRWNKKTDKVYVWDYINDFDDYFTPYPAFSAMQRRLQLYRDMNVKGVFLNGSGDDYSTFHNLKMQVLAGLLDNPDADWREILRDKASGLYPVAGNLIADFIIAQEEYVESTQSQLPFYNGVNEALKTYLPEKEFIEFHDRLGEILPETKGSERIDVEKMYKAMALTRLEIMRIKGDIDGNGPFIALLESLDRDDGITRYSETGWTVPGYVADFREMARFARETDRNLLKGVRPEPLSKLDPEYADVTMLTDGLLSLPSNYHNGMMIMSPEGKWRIAVPYIEGMKTLKVWMPVNKAFRVGVPGRVNLLVGGVLEKSAVPLYPAAPSHHTSVEFNIPSEPRGSLILEFVPDPDSPTFAIEEIQAF